ncbi:Hypothetical predicted protein [Octopus vulgaris]|uniref:Uncharacterized protein n=1 Tax=Octopus vulgaris TaxID=6645 RepID=A0AA36FEH4_OCTVU|nr:Hypothetical predicted protein [Octopus vulgaris]
MGSSEEFPTSWKFYRKLHGKFRGFSIFRIPPSEAERRHKHKFSIESNSGTSDLSVLIDSLGAAIIVEFLLTFNVTKQ